MGTEGIRHIPPTFLLIAKLLEVYVSGCDSPLRIGRPDCVRELAQPYRRVLEFGHVASINLGSDGLPASDPGFGLVLGHRREGCVIFATDLGDQVFHLRAYTCFQIGVPIVDGFVKRAGSIEDILSDVGVDPGLGALYFGNLILILI
jgi:hypothetical protein